MGLMAMLQGWVATQVKAIHPNFSCHVTPEFQSDVTAPPQQANVVMELMTFGMSFESAVENPVKGVREDKISLLFNSVRLFQF